MKYHGKRVEKAGMGGDHVVIMDQERISDGSNILFIQILYWDLLLGL